MKYLSVIVLLAAGLWFSPQQAQAACTTQVVESLGTHIRYSGSCANDNEVLITTGDMSQYEACSLVSTTGAVDVLISLDGTNYTTAAESLIDLGATDTAPVVVTAALRHYAFPLVGVARVRILQNGATAAAAFINCV